MEDFRTSTPATNDLHPFRSLLILLGFILLGMGLGGFLAGLLIVGWVKEIDNGSINDAFDILNNPDQVEGSWYLLMAIQAVSHLCSFLIPSLLYWRLVEHRRWANFNIRPLSMVHSIGLVVLLTVAFMPFNGLLIDWNQNLDLPESLAGLERWMKAQEDQLAKFTTFLTNFDSPLQLLIALVVIAVIPAIGEEVLFRGLVQRKLAYWTANVHVAVWLAAAIFSAIHIQFYGFIPRMLLGALFGYLYVWSGNLWVPILAHFINNGFTVLMVWLYHRHLITVDIENTESVPLMGAIVSLLLTTGFLVYFRRTNQSPSQPYV